MKLTDYFVIAAFVLYAATSYVGFAYKDFSKELIIGLSAVGGALLAWWILMKTGILPETKTIKCPKCGNTLRETARFCGGCGSNI